MSHYHTLGVNTNATTAEIKSAYRRLVKIYHPDLNPGAGTHEQMLAINEAYEVLSDYHSRNMYDMMLSGYAVPKEPKKETEEERYRREYKRKKAQEERMHIENLVKLKVRFYKAERWFAYAFFAIGIIFTVDYFVWVKEEVHEIKRIDTSRRGTSVTTTQNINYQAERSLFQEHERLKSDRIIVNSSLFFNVPARIRVVNGSGSYRVFGTLHSFRNVITMIILVFSAIVIKHKEYTDFRLTCGLMPILLVIFQLLMVAVDGY